MARVHFKKKAKKLKRKNKVYTTSQKAKVQVRSMPRRLKDVEALEERITV